MRFQSGLLLPCLREYSLKPNHLMLFKDNGYGVRSMYERIRNMREDKDMTQADMAAYLNIHQTTYSDYETTVTSLHAMQSVQPSSLRPYKFVALLSGSHFLHNLSSTQSCI